MSTERARNPEEPHKTDLGDDVWYERFTSIIFGVFITVWIIPFADLFPNDQNNSAFLETLSFGFPVRGLLMFLVLICLWWWYARVISVVLPAKGFCLFVYDFITLASFALAFRFWSHDFAYPVTIIMGAALMFLRLCSILPGIWKEKAIRWVVISALILSGLIAFGGVIFVAALYYVDAVEEIWNVVRGIVTTLLCLGVLVTLIAVHLTERLSWTRPRIRWFTPEK